MEMLEIFLKEAHDRQNNSAYKRRNDFELQVGDFVYLNMRTFHGEYKIRKLRELKPSYVEPYPLWSGLEQCVIDCGYKKREFSGFHEVFHVSFLRKVVRAP